MAPCHVHLIADDASSDAIVLLLRAILNMGPVYCLPVCPSVNSSHALWWLRLGQIYPKAVSRLSLRGFVRIFFVMEGRFVDV